MRRIAIEEVYNYPQNKDIRISWCKRENMPDMMDKEQFLNKIIPQQSAPLDTFRIPEMDKAGISMQVLSSGSPGVQGCFTAQEAVPLAVEMNDMLADEIKKYPDRFNGFCAVPTQDPEAAAREMERCKKLGFCGAMIQGRTNGLYMDNEIFYPVWEAAQELDMPISFHVLDTNVDNMRIFEGCYGLLGPGWSWNLEAATHVLRVVINGVFERYPGVQLICGHMGEGLPYYLGRIDEGFMSFSGHLEGKINRLPSEFFKTNIYISTSGKYYPPAMKCAVEAMGADRILFAEDYPFISMKEGIELLEACSLTEEEKELIYHLNAERVLHV